MNLNCFLTLMVALTHALVCVTLMLIFSFAAHAIADQMQVTWVALQTCLPATNAGYPLFVHEASVRRCTRRFIFRVNEDALVVSKRMISVTPPALLIPELSNSAATYR